MLESSSKTTLKFALKSALKLLRISSKTALKLI